MICRIQWCQNYLNLSVFSMFFDLHDLMGLNGLAVYFSFSFFFKLRFEIFYTKRTQIWKSFTPLASINHVLFYRIFSTIFFQILYFEFEFIYTGRSGYRTGPVFPVTAVNRGNPAGIKNRGSGPVGLLQLFRFVAFMVCACGPSP